MLYLWLTIIITIINAKQFKKINNLNPNLFQRFVATTHSKMVVNGGPNSYIKL